MSEPSIDDPKLLASYRTALAEFGGNKEVTGVDIGYLYESGRRTEKPGIRVHFGDISPRKWLKSAEFLPEMIDGVRVMPVRATYRLHDSAAPDSLPTIPLQPPIRRTTRFDPIQPGVSVSHHMLRGGTLGLIVYDQLSGEACILSNWHVLAGHPGARPGDPIVQPGAGSGGSDPGHTIATLHRSIFDQDGDAAIAKLNGKRGINPAQVDTDVVITTARIPRLGEIVVKSGVRTGVTAGLVDGCGRYFLRMPAGNEVVVGMDGFRIVPLDDRNADDREVSGSGDSGSVWYSADDQAGVGLHVAGEASADPTQELGIACYLPPVLARLEVGLVPPGSSPRLLATSPDAEEGDSQALLAESVARLTRVVERLLSERGRDA